MAGTAKLSCSFSSSIFASRKGTTGVEDGVIASGAHVMRGDERQPEQVVRDAGAHSTTGLWMPPVLDIALDELPCSRTLGFARG
jgi:hypothetical protein